MLPIRYLSVTYPLHIRYISVTPRRLQGQFEDDSNSLATITVPVTAVINLMPLACQRLLDGGPGAVVHLLRFELLFIGYGLLCRYDLMFGSFYFKSALGLMLLCLPHASLFFSFGNRNMVRA